MSSCSNFFKLLQTKVNRNLSNDIRYKKILKKSCSKWKLDEVVGGGLIIRIDKIRACAVDRRTRKSSSRHNGRVAAELIQVEHVETHAGNGASLRPHKTANGIISGTPDFSRFFALLKFISYPLFLLRLNPITKNTLDSIRYPTLRDFLEVSANWM